jgi:hypothetical protein
MYLLCEKLLKTEGLKLLQVNTDGLTIRYPRRAITEVQSVMDWWQNKTKLKLAEFWVVQYRMLRKTLTVCTV